MRNGKYLLLTISLGVYFSTALAVPVFYQGGDAGVGPGGARLNSHQAATDFDSAAGGLGVVRMIDFEDLSSGPFSSLFIAPGVKVTLGNTAANMAANGISTVDDVITGYSTTPGGGKHLGVCPEWGSALVTATFSFDSPIEAFGAYLTGVETASGDLHVLFNDGSARDLRVTGNPNGGVQFFGFISQGAAITSVSMELRDALHDSRDVFGVDDLRFVSIPEPATMVLLGLAGFVLRKRRQS